MINRYPQQDLHIDADGNLYLLYYDSVTRHVTLASSRSLFEPVALVNELIDGLVDLDLPGGTENSLIAKLDVAEEKLSDDNEMNDGAAINALQAFINAVNAQRGKKIPEEDADALIEEALRIIDLLSLTEP
jgi:hypothetical protein